MLKRILFLPMIMMMLVSCYSHKIFLNQDKKSGRMVIDYTMNNDYLSILSTALVNFQTNAKDNVQKIDPNALIDQKLFKTTFKNTDDISLKAVSIKTTTVNKKSIYTGHIEVVFNDFEKALKQLPEGMMNISVIKDNSNITVTQIMNMAKMDPKKVFLNFLDEEKDSEPEIYNKLTKDAVFKFDIETKTPMKKVEGVSLSSKMTASYKFTINSLLKNKDKNMKFLITF